MYSRSSRSSDVMVTLSLLTSAEPRQARHDGLVVLVVRGSHRLADLDPGAVFDRGLVALGQVVLVAVRLARDDLDDARVFGALQLDDAVDLGEDRLALRHAGLEQLLDARQTGRDVDTRDTAGVERTHRELRARLADRLRGDDADGVADLRPARRVPRCQP